VCFALRRPPPYGTLLALAFIASADYAGFAKEPVRWQDAKVVYSHHEFVSDHNIAGNSGVVQSAHESLDVDAGSVTYSVEEWVVPSQLLRLREGSRVQISISGKMLTIKLANGKLRKLKIAATYPKQDKK
jgi:hypothetical protein